MKALHIERADLYDQVWAEPMTKVADRLGVSDVGLAKACARADIPTPPRGHWAKLQAGKRVKRPVLPPLQDWQPELVTLVPAPPRRKRTTDPPAIAFEDIARSLKQEEGAGPISPDTALKDPHPLIDRAMHAQRDYRSWALSDDSPHAREQAANEPLTKRRCAILSGLFKALERRGVQVGEPETRNGSTRYTLAVAGENIDLTFRERVRQARRDLTKEERSRSWNRGRTWTQERFQTGELVLSVARTTPLPWEEWSDQPTLPLEDQLHAVVIGVYRAAAVERTRRLEREAFADRYREEQHQQWIETETKKLQAARVADLVQQAHDWQVASSVRCFVAAAESAHQRGELPSDASDLDSWIGWATAVADTLDPIGSKKVLETLQPPMVDAKRSPYRRD